MNTEIISIETVPTLLDLEDVVCKVDFSLEEELDITDPDGLPMSIKFVGSCFLNAPSGDSFSAYNSLTETQVVSWIENTTEFTETLEKLNREVQIFELQGLQTKELPWIG